MVSVEDVAASIRAKISARRPSGSYRLVGYSTGGILAFELARQFIAAGESVEALFLIDTAYDECFWPPHMRLVALARRTGLRMRRRARIKTPAVEESCGPAATSAYRPGCYNGTMTLIASSGGGRFGCDLARLWQGCADDLVIYRVVDDDDHATRVHDPSWATAVAGVIDHQLVLARNEPSGLEPVRGFERPLIVTTMRWFGAARLAHSLIQVGFSVSSCSPSGHALRMVDGLTTDCRLNRLSPLRSVHAAIRRSCPDVILADDERALVLLRKLHALTETADPETASLIARSLGHQKDWPSLASRAAVAREARALGIAVPATAVVRTEQELAAWASGDTPPFVMKTDGSFGGLGVAIVGDASQLRKAWRTLRGPPTLAYALKRAVVNAEVDPIKAWVRRTRRVVNAQHFLAGRDAIATAACLDGEVLAMVCLEVVQASEAKGPAAVVRTIDHPGMAEAARRMVERFGLNGFCGFDFILDETGVARLLEMNPRVTPTSHLHVEGDYRRNRTITLFPVKPASSDEHGVALSGVLDIPMNAPRLIRHGEVIAARERRLLARLKSRLKQRLTVARY
jgi:pimeloyl-ACP methyl ester carboxylesterase